MTCGYIALGFLIPIAVLLSCALLFSSSMALAAMLGNKRAEKWMDKMGHRP